jgi:hypothetical protein
MMDAIATLAAHPHFPYIWPCYALAAVTIAGLSWRARRNLLRWKARADRDR